MTNTPKPQANKTIEEFFTHCSINQCKLLAESIKVFNLELCFKHQRKIDQWLYLKGYSKLKGDKMSNKMETYKPSTELFYVIESDGDAWFAHYNNFTNVVESDEVAFGKTPQEALQKFIELKENK